MEEGRKSSESRHLPRIIHLSLYRRAALFLIVLCFSLGLSHNVYSAVESAGDVVFSTNQVLGQNGDYPFAGIYVFENLTLADNVEITSSGISQLVIKVNGRLTLGRNAVIRVRNGYYPEAPVNPITELNATNMASKGILSSEGTFVFQNTFGRGGNGGNGGCREPSGCKYGGGGGYGGGNGGVEEGYENGGNGGSAYGDDGIGGGSINLGSKGTGRIRNCGSNLTQFCYGGGGGGNGGDGAPSYASGGGGGGGYGGGILYISANSIFVVDYTQPSHFLVSSQKGGLGGDGTGPVTVARRGQNGYNGQGGLLILQNAGWNYTDGRSARQALQYLWNLDAGTYGQHIRPSTNGGHGVVTGNPQKVFVNGMEIPVVDVTGLTLSQSEFNLSVGGNPGSLSATVLPADANVREVVWSVDRPDIASLTDVQGITGKVIEPLKAGTAVITATTVDGSSTARAVVYVDTVAKPSFNVVGGSYETGQSVVISCSTPDATIRYTTDGSTPTATNGTEVTSGASVAVSTSTALKAVAYKSGLQNSLVNEAVYTINGSLKVTLGPSGLVPTAQWRVDGGIWQNSAVTQSGLSAGNHTLEFKDIGGGWYKPSTKTVTVSSGQLTTLTGTYSQTPPTSSLSVTITPAEALSAGAQWRIAGGAWQNSGATLSGLSLGNKTVEFKEVYGWTTPASQTVSIIEDELTRTQAVYAVVTYSQAQLDAAVNAMAAQKDQTIIQLNQQIAGMYTKAQLDTAVNAMAAQKDQTITQLNQQIAGMYTKAQLDAAVNAVAAQKDQTIAQLNQQIAGMYSQAQLDTAVNAMAAQKDQTISQLNQQIAGMYSQAQFDTAVNAVTVQKDETIAQLNQQISAMFSQDQLNQAVTAERLRWDVGDDQKIGLAEAIRALQMTAGIR